MCKMGGGVLTIQGQTVKILLQNPDEIEHFWGQNV